MKLNGNLTLARLGTEPEAEFKDCSRCGIPLTPGSDMAKCLDCKGINVGNGCFLPIDPAYEVSLHYPKQPQLCPTAKTLDALRIPYVSYTATQDPSAVRYAKKLITSNEPGPDEYPIVVITSHGDYMEHWTGFNLTKLNLIPTARDLTINHIVLSADCVPSRELVAA